MKVVGMLLKLCLVLAVGWIGITFARQAYTHGIETVIASEPAPAKFDTAPMATWDSDCLLGPMNDRPVNQNHCHAQAVWWKQDSAAKAQPDPLPDTGMTKDDSVHAALWFGGSMLAILLALGAAGAGVMWMVKD
jgi:hypothetical protein